jgi:hypothetical protein
MEASSLETAGGLTVLSTGKFTLHVFDRLGNRAVISISFPLVFMLFLLLFGHENVLGPS